MLGISLLCPVVGGHQRIVNLLFTICLCWLAMIAELGVILPSKIIKLKGQLQFHIALYQELRYLCPWLYSINFTSLPIARDCFCSISIEICKTPCFLFIYDSIGHQPQNFITLLISLKTIKFSRAIMMFTVTV